MATASGRAELDMYYPLLQKVPLGGPCACPVRVLQATSAFAAVAREELVMCEREELVMREREHHLPFHWQSH